MVIEQVRWHSHRTAWKPHGDNARNLRTVQDTEPDIVVEGNLRWAGGEHAEEQISEWRETYHAKFSVDAGGGERKYVTELDEGT